MSAAATAVPGVSFKRTLGDYGVLLDRAGREVRASGPSWRLNHATMPVLLNWRRIGDIRPETFESIQSFMAEIVKARGATTVLRYFNLLVLLSNSAPFLTGQRSGEDIEFGVITGLRTALGKNGYTARLLREG